MLAFAEEDEGPAIVAAAENADQSAWSDKKLPHVCRIPQAERAPCNEYAAAGVRDAREPTSAYRQVKSARDLRE